MELLGGVTSRGVQLDQLGVHGVAVGEVANPRMLVVAGRGEDVGLQALAVARQRRPDLLVDLGGQPIAKAASPWSAECHPTDGLVRGEEFDLGHGRLHQPSHGRAPRRSAFPMPFGHGGEHAGEPRSRAT